MPARPENRVPTFLERRGVSLSLGDLAKPVLILPGNHDRYRDILGFPGKLFYQYFSPFWDTGPGGVCSFLIPSDSPILAIVSADFSLQKPLDYEILIRGHSNPVSGYPKMRQMIGRHWGRGRVYSKVLKTLRDKTLQIRSSYPDCGILWAIHFAPESAHQNIDPNMVLVHSQYLIRQAEKLGIKYILCGHIHRSAAYPAGSDDSVSIHCTGTATCLSKREETVIHLRDFSVQNGTVMQMRSRAIDYNRRLNIFRPRQ